jgi:Flp pilus assembly protein CpaB
MGELSKCPLGCPVAATHGAKMTTSTANRLLWKLGILAAMTIAVAALSYYQLQSFAVTAAEQQQRAQQQQMIPILVLAQDLDSDVRLDMTHFQQRKFPPQYIQDNWLEPHDASGLVGLKTTRFLARGEPLTLDAFRLDYRHHFSQRLAENQYALTVNLGIEQLHHGMLSVGDRVLLYSASRLAQQQAIWLENIEILAVDRQQYASQHELSLPTTVTFSMTAEQAKEFELMRTLNFQVWLQHPEHNYRPLLVTGKPTLHHMQTARSAQQ